MTDEDQRMVELIARTLMTEDDEPEDEWAWYANEARAVWAAIKSSDHDRAVRVAALTEAADALDTGEQYTYGSTQEWLRARAGAL